MFTSMFTNISNQSVACYTLTACGAKYALTRSALLGNMPKGARPLDTHFRTLAGVRKQGANAPCVFAYLVN